MLYRDAVGVGVTVNAVLSLVLVHEKYEIFPIFSSRAPLL
jgi:hypothetical protein